KAEERVMSTTPNKQTKTSKVDGYQEPKQGIYPRNLLNSRSRPIDTIGSRPGVASISTHSSTPKPEQKCKNIRAVNTIGVREEYTAGGPTNIKLVRGTRSGPMVAARFKYMHLPLMIGSFQTPQGRMVDLTENGSRFVKRVLVNSPSSTPSEIKESGEEGEDNENDDIESNGYGSTFEDETSLKSNGFMEFNYQTMSMDNKLLMEIQSIRLSPELMPNEVRKVDDEIDGRINDLENKYHEQSSYGPNAHGCKSVGTKLAKKQALATVKQILEQCHEFEMIGKISFTDNESG
nr:hypothetical protein [Tanacetum cinerariifolium]